MVQRFSGAQLPVPCETDPYGHNGVWIYDDSTYPIRFETTLANSAGAQDTIWPQSLSGENIRKQNGLHDRHNSQLNHSLHVNRCILNSVLLFFVLLIIIIFIIVLVKSSENV